MMRVLATLATVAALALAASCGSSGGRSSGSLGGDAGDRDGATNCGGLGEECCNGSACNAGLACSGATACVAAPPPSCSLALSEAGTTNCGASSDNCCTSLAVAGGTYFRTYTNTGSGPTGEADPATVSRFRLDKYIVTVGRFRQFVNAVLPADGGVGWTPPQGSGKHTHLHGGQGLANGSTAGTYETGWVASDDPNIAPTSTNLGCDFEGTWTDSPGSHETLPMNCVNWWEAYAFCIWDGGFLPSESEWEYAAAGGSQEREYPWGSSAPGTASRYAIYGCYYPGSTGTCTLGVGNLAPVGTATLGAGLWGQLDLAGEVAEWVRDWYSPAYADPCVDCALLTAPKFSDRVSRGGDFDTTELAPSLRLSTLATGRNYQLGFRCARTP